MTFKSHHGEKLEHRDTRISVFMEEPDTSPMPEPCQWLTGYRYDSFRKQLQAASPQGTLVFDTVYNLSKD